MKWKLAIGIVLIALSIVGMYFWENGLRDEITMTEVLVPATNISANRVVSKEDLKLIHVNPDAVIAGAMTADNAQAIYGKLSSRDLVENEQLLERDFITEEDLTPEGYRHFVIPSDWIFSKSITLEERKYVKIYAMPEEEELGPESYYLGRYKLAVLQAETELEILATIDDYFKLYEAHSLFGMQFVLVAEDE